MAMASASRLEVSGLDRFAVLVTSVPFFFLNTLFIALTLKSWRAGLAMSGFLLFALLFRKLRSVYSLGVAAAFVIATYGQVLGFANAFSRSESWFRTICEIIFCPLTCALLLVTYGMLFGIRRGGLSQYSAHDCGSETESRKETSYASPDKEQKPLSVSTSFDPYKILKLDASASPSEIRTAYLNQMQLYHPDRVEHLGPELKRVAHEQSLAIRRAYEQLNIA